MYGEQMGWWERLMLHFRPSPQTVVEAELKAAKLAVLQSQSMAEYAALRVSIHSITADYHTKRGARLQAYLDDNSFEHYRNNPQPGDHIPGY